MIEQSYFKLRGKITVPLIFLFLLVIPLSSAVPPVSTIQQFTEGYVIEGTPTEIIKQNTDYQYNFFAYNISNGVQIQSDTADCTFYMADSQGVVILTTKVPKVDGYWALTINGANFSETGHYPYGVRCNSTSLGGATVNYFTITSSGVDFPSSYFWLIILFGYGLIIFGLWKEDYAITTLGSFALAFVGLYMLSYGIDGIKSGMTNAFSIVTMVIAGYVMVKMGLNFIKESYD